MNTLSPGLPNSYLTPLELTQIVAVNPSIP